MFNQFNCQKNLKYLLVMKANFSFTEQRFFCSSKIFQIIDIFDIVENVIEKKQVKIVLCIFEMLSSSKQLFADFAESKAEKGGEKQGNLLKSQL